MGTKTNIAGFFLSIIGVIDCWAKNHYFESCKNWSEYELKSQLLVLQRGGYESISNIISEYFELLNHSLQSTPNGENSYMRALRIKKSFSDCRMRVDKSPLSGCYIRLLNFIEQNLRNSHLRDFSGYGFKRPVDEYLKSQPESLVALPEDLQKAIVSDHHLESYLSETSKWRAWAREKKMPFIEFSGEYVKKAILIIPGKHEHFILVQSKGFSQITAEASDKNNEIYLHFRDLDIDQGRLVPRANDGSCTSCHASSKLIDINRGRTVTGGNITAKDFNARLAKLRDRVNWRGDFDHKEMGPPLSVSSCYSCHTGEKHEQGILNYSDLTLIHSLVHRGTMPPEFKEDKKLNRAEFHKTLTQNYTQKDLGPWFFEPCLDQLNKEEPLQTKPKSLEANH